MVKLERMDFCKVVGNTRSTRNGFVKRLFDEVKKFAPSILRRCPVNGRYQLVNFTISESFSHTNWILLSEMERFFKERAFSENSI